MGRRSDIDKAIRNIIKWSEGPAWADWREEVFQGHLAPVCKHLDLTLEALRDELVVSGYAGMLYGIQFEDFLSREAAAGNPVDDYLNRRGWRESVRGRRYLKALRDSVLSLYEVVDVSPGHYCEVRDLLRPGKTVRVYEKVGTQQMAKWDRIAARVLSEEGKHLFSGGILPFSPEAVQSLLRVLDNSHEALQTALETLSVEADGSIDLPLPQDMDDHHLREACPAFSNIWLMHTLSRQYASLPELYNSDGDPISFFETHFPLSDETDAIRQAIIQRLEAAPEWVLAGEEPFFWNWLESAPPARKEVPADAKSIDAQLEGRHPVSGNLELGRRRLIFSTNSEARTERGKAVLGELLAGLVGVPLSQVQSPEQIMAGGDEHEAEPAAAEIDPKESEAMIHAYLDRHYQTCLNEPIPALGNMSPRQCAADPAHRSKVVDWLKQLENSEQRRVLGTGQTPYDTQWLWETLGLEP